MSQYAGTHRLEDCGPSRGWPLELLALRASIVDRRMRQQGWAAIYGDGRHDLHRGCSFIGAGRDLNSRTRMLRAKAARRTDRIDAGRAA